MSPDAPRDPLEPEERRWHTVEMTAARRDIETKAAYIEMLEAAAVRHQGQIADLQAQVAAQDAARAALPEALERAARAERDLADALRRAAAAESEVAAFRSRTATVIGDALSRRCPRGAAMIRATARRLRRR